MKKVKGGSNSEKAEQPEQANYEKRENSEKGRGRRGVNLNSGTHERITEKRNYEKREKGRGDGRRFSCRCARWARLIGKAANTEIIFRQD